MENFNNELLEKAKQAKSVEELLELAKANKMSLTEEQAKIAYAGFHPTSGELSDDELDNVAGGGCGHEEREHFDLGDTVMCLHDKCPKCGGNIGRYEIIGDSSFEVWDVVCSACNDTEIIAWTWTSETGRIKKA